MTNEKIYEQLRYLTAVVLELREDTKALRKEIKAITSKHREINSLRASLATVSAERKLLRNVQSTLSRLITPDPVSHEMQQQPKRKYARDY